MALPLSYNVRNLRSRWKVTLLAIFGIALVVAAFVTILSMARGFNIALSSTGSDNNAIVTQRGSMSELTSWIDIGNANLIAVDPRVARGADGKPHGFVRSRRDYHASQERDRHSHEHHLPRGDADRVQGAQQHQDCRGQDVHARPVRGDCRQEDCRPRERRGRWFHHQYSAQELEGGGPVHRR